VAGVSTTTTTLAYHVHTTGIHWDAATIATICVAVFTGTTALISYLAYQHGRSRAGHRKPVRASRPIFPGHVDRGIWPSPPHITGYGDIRSALFVVLLSLFNQSDFPQNVTIEAAKCRFVWPRRKDWKWGEGIIELPAHGGGIVGVWVTTPEDSPLPAIISDEDRLFRGFFLVRFCGRTAGGKRVRHFGRVRAGPR
jgi:hypothetical protein